MKQNKSRHSTASQQPAQTSGLQPIEKFVKGPGMKILVVVFFQFLVIRPGGDPDEMLVKSCA